MSTIAPTAFAAAAISATGFSVPSAFDNWTMDSIFVRGVSRRSNSSITRSPRSSIGMTLSVAPVRSQRSCHGTMFEWCSMPEMRISSPWRTFASPQARATRLMLSVAFLVKMISCTDAAFTNARTFSRAPSYAAVARSLSSWTPRCTFALSCS